jgi:hypothetical protein
MSSDRLPGARPIESGRLVVQMQTPRAAALAEMAFAVMMTALVVILHLAVPPGWDQMGWIGDPARRRRVAWAMELGPFAGIAFMWFIGVIRARLGDREDKVLRDRLSGLRLVLRGHAVHVRGQCGALLLLYDDGGGLPADEMRLVSLTSSVLVASFGIRTAVVFVSYVTGRALLTSKPCPRP